MPLAAWMLYQTEETHRAAVNKFIPIPRIKVTDAGVEEYVFVDFDLDMADFTHVPIKNELLVQNLEDMQDRQRIKGDAIDFEGYQSEKGHTGATPTETGDRLRKMLQTAVQADHASLRLLRSTVWHQWNAEHHYDV